MLELKSYKYGRKDSVPMKKKKTQVHNMMVVLEYSTVGVLRLSDTEHISFPFLISFSFPWAFAYAFLLVPVGRSIGLRLLLAAHTHHGSGTDIITWLDIRAVCGILS